MPNKHIKIEPTTIEEEYKTYTTKSVLRLVPSRNYNNQKFICKVSHPTLPDGHKKYSLNISVQCKCQDPAVNWNETIKCYRIFLFRSTNRASNHTLFQKWPSKLCCRWESSSKTNLEIFSIPWANTNQNLRKLAKISHSRW